MGNIISGGRIESKQHFVLAINGQTAKFRPHRPRYSKGEIFEEHKHSFFMRSGSMRARAIIVRGGPTKRIAIWQPIGISGHRIAGSHCCSATVVSWIFPRFLPLSLSLYTLPSSHHDSGEQQARVNAKLGCLPWRGARLISRAKPADSKDIGTDCFRLCRCTALSKRPAETLVRFLIKPAPWDNRAEVRKRRLADGPDSQMIAFAVYHFDVFAKR